MKEKQDSDASVSDIGCHVCASPAIEVVPGYELFRRVTSDCKPWPSGGRLCVCRACGCLQKAIDPAWLGEIEQIYDSYTIYHQSGGIEQAVFRMGKAQSRSEQLLELVQPYLPLADAGRLLDIGCGNGAFLQAFSRFAPRWSLAGTELSNKHRQAIESIERVESLYTVAPDQVPGEFRIISMIHVLEHIPSPGNFLSLLRDKIESDGLLLIEVPDHRQNPFDLLIADHSTHFTADTLAPLVERSGYRVLATALDWVPKELTVLARRSALPGRAETQKLASILDSPFNLAVKSLNWLESVVQAASECSATGNFGLFGTSIAATWLFGELENSVSFFVDEDPHRAGKTYMGRPVYDPHQVPNDTHVFMALPARFAEAVCRRVAKPGVTYHLPPSLELATSP